MPWDIYEFLDHRGDGIIVGWIKREKIQKAAIAVLSQKVDLLRRVGQLPPQLLAGPIEGHIYKLKVKGRVQLRPMLSKGPINNDTEYTFLLGCVERGGELDPLDAPGRAEANRKIIIGDNNRRKRHDADF
jgi:hypothetical protein